MGCGGQWDRAGADGQAQHKVLSPLPGWQKDLGDGSCPDLQLGISLFSANLRSVPVECQQCGGVFVVPGPCASAAGGKVLGEDSQEMEVEMGMVGLGTLVTLSLLSSNWRLLQASCPHPGSAAALSPSWHLGGLLCPGCTVLGTLGSPKFLLLKVYMVMLPAQDTALHVGFSSGFGGG